jgi:proteasome lid subunit RPN8/RPN11
MRGASRFVEKNAPLLTSGRRQPAGVQTRPVSLVVAKDHDEAIRRHAESAYPEECCGVIGGTADGVHKRVRAVVELPNRRPDSRHNRYFAPPEAIARAERELGDQGLEVIGFYHSHPDAPARPSGYDLEHATWPWLSYVIVSVMEGAPRDMSSWTLADDRSRFDPESIEKEASAEPPDSHPAGARPATERRSS